jgi:hypothetical protein
MFLGLCRPRAPLRVQWLCSGTHAIRRPVPENAACCWHRNAHGGAVTTAEQLQAELWVFFDQENWVWPGVAIQAIVFSRPSCQPSSLPQSRTHINRHTRLSNEWPTSAQCDRSQQRLSRRQRGTACLSGFGASHARCCAQLCRRCHSWPSQSTFLCVL